MTDRPAAPEPTPGGRAADDAERYPFAAIEPKWRARWEELGLFRQDLADAHEKYYCLNMFPYPSGDLHVGHGRNYILGDAVVRYALLRGKRVFAVMGWDAFGLPAENAAIANRSHPETWTLQNITRMKRQFHDWGIGFDWSREVASCHPGYYKWTQWIFLKLFERGLAYRGQAPVNWCPSCRTVLANEQVVDGRCERCDSPVTLRDLEQWFFRITAYAQRLLDDLALLPEWPEKVRVMQENWIGRSEGAECHWQVEGTGEDIVTFTTRLDTVFGATFLVLAPNHPLVAPLTAGRPEETACREFAARTARQLADRRFDVEPEKEGVFTGRHGLHPFTGRPVPIWLANYVVMGYGTGAVQCVPAHDTRDYEFAR
jgi:leucyl-tRNA synthetase